MALPTVVKTWQFDLNQMVGGLSSQETCVDDLWLAIKNSLIGFASSPWTVWGSCDSVTAYNDDGTDCWDDASDIVHAQVGVAHSWIVLENAVIGVQVCIDLRYPLTGSYFPNHYLFASWAGFNADGTTTTAPTASDRVTVVDDDRVCPPAAFTGKLHVMHSTDGEETRVLVCYNNQPTVFWCFGMAADRASVWTTGFLAAKSGDSASMLTYELFNDAANFHTSIDGDVRTLYCTSEMMGTSMLGQSIIYSDDDTGDWPFCSIGLVNTTGVHRGRKGEIVDLWWGSTAVATGTAFPSDASRDFVQFGDMIVPWDGSVPQIS